MVIKYVWCDLSTFSYLISSLLFPIRKLFRTLLGYNVKISSKKLAADGGDYIDDDMHRASRRLKRVKYNCHTQPQNSTS